MSELKHIISKGEGVQLDFKTEISDSQKIASTLVAFANTKGGSLLIGVKDTGKIKGVDPSEEIYMVDQAISKYVKPGIQYTKLIWQERHHIIVEIIIAQSSVKHLAKDDNNEWRSFIRINDHTCHTNKIIDLAWRLSDSFVENSKYNVDCQNEIKGNIKLTGLTLSKLYSNSSFSLKVVDFNLSCLFYLNQIELSFVEEKIVYSLVQ